MRYIILFFSLCLGALAQQNGIWTDPVKAAKEADYNIQGEYASEKFGAQLIALGKGQFCAVVYPGGLPGDGWDLKNKTVLHSTSENGKISFKVPKGKLSYVNKDAAKFSPVKKYPPTGQKSYSAFIEGDTLKLKTDNDEWLTLKKRFRKSPTLGMSPPAGAKVLFDGSNKDAFNGGRLDENTKLLNTDGKDIRSKDKFNNYRMHIEFMLPYKPNARGQSRGNSGFYQVDQYEVQVLDSFGLEGVDNECGGVYKKAVPKVNMCLSPLTWQTYDVEFTNAVIENGKVLKHAIMTLRHNGVLIHENLEIIGKTGGARKEPIGTAGPIRFQGHGNPVQYRNIWIIKK